MGVKIENKNVIALRIGNTPIVKRYINGSIVYRSVVPEVTDYDILAVYNVDDTSSATRILSNINHVEYAYINDRPIGVAMDYAFAQSGTYTLKVKLQDKIDSVPSYSFKSCKNLVSVDISARLTVLGTEAFYGCTKLTSVTLPDTLTAIYADAFYNCNSLTSVEIPTTVTEIGSSAFENCSSLTSIVIPDSVTSIGDYAFDSCSNLANITVNATTAPALGNSVFNDVSNDGVLYYPCGSDYSSWMTQLNQNTAAVWTSECIKSEFEYNVTMTCISPSSDEDIYFLNDVSRVEKMEIDGVEVTPVGNKTFDSGVHLIKVKFSDYSIPSNTLYNINAISMNEDIESIETGAFQLTTKLTSVTVSPYNKYYTAQDNCVIELLSGKMIAGVGEFTIPEDVTSIGVRAAWNNDFITEISIPDSVTTIEDGAFTDCTNLSSVTIGSGVTSVGNGVFTRCSKLSSITCNATTAPAINGYLDEWVSYGEYSIAAEGTFNYPCGSDYSTWLAQLPNEWVDGCASEEPSYNVIATYRTTSNNSNVKVLGNTTSLTKMNVDGEDVDNTTSVVFPTAGEHVVKFLYSDVDTLPGQAFGSSSSWVNGAELETVEVKSLNLGSYTFARCKKLKSVILNDVKVLGNYAFNDCSGLTSIDMQDSVTTIGERVFLNCSGLTSIDIPNSVTSIGTNAFSSCKNLASIEIPDSVTSLGNQAFYGCDKVTSITIGSGLTSIGNNVFPTANVESITVNKGEVFEGDNCIIKNNGSWTSLVLGCKNTVIPSEVNHIGDYAFDGCSGLTSIEIPEICLQIGSRAFFGCSNLTSVRIPSEVMTLGTYAFQNCSSLKNVIIEAALSSIPIQAFQGCTSLENINIPDSVTKIDNYAFSNCTSLTDVVIPDSVTSLGTQAFIKCTSLTDIVIPDSVTNLGLYAFNGCSGLTSVRLSNSITLLRNNVFENCTSLTDVVIPDSVTEIGNYAFSNCTSLTSITIPSNVTRLGQYSFRGCTNLSRIESVATTAPTLGTDVFANIAAEGTFNYPCESDYSTWIEALPAEWVDGCTIEEPSYDVTATVVVTSTTSTTALAKTISGMSAMFIDGVEVAPTSAYTFSTTGEHTVGYNFASTSLSSNVYSGCSTITEIVIGDRITSLASGSAALLLLQGTFGNMPSLEKVTIGNGITSLSATYGGLTSKSAVSPFGNCPSLMEINLGESITAITGPVFMGCEHLSSITIPSKVTALTDYSYSGGTYGVFQGCTNLEEVTFEGTTAPSIDVHTFPNGNAGIFYYPCGSDYSAVANQLSSWTDGCTGNIGGDGDGGDGDEM